MEHARTKHRQGVPTRFLFHEDTGNQKVTLDQAADFCGTASFPTDNVETQATHYFYLTFGDVRDQNKLDLAPERKVDDFAAMAVFQLHINREGMSKCLILALKVDEDMRGKGIGTQLYLAMHQRAFQECQGLPPFQCGATDGLSQEDRNTRAATGKLQFELADGSCRRHDRFLTLLSLFGWLGADSAPARLDLFMGYSTPAVKMPSMGEDSFQDVTTLGAPPQYIAPASRHLSWQILHSTCRITPSGPLICRQEGLFSFLVSSRPCQKTLLYLESDVNWHNDSSGPVLALAQPTTVEENRMPVMKLHPNVNQPKQSVSKDVRRLPQTSLISRNPNQAKHIMVSVPGDIDHSSSPPVHPPPLPYPQSRCLLTPGMMEIGREVLHAILGQEKTDVRIDGLVHKIKCVHFFPVDKYMQASYAYHTDCSELVNAICVGSKASKSKVSKSKASASPSDQGSEEKQLFGIRSVVVQLGAATTTAMHMSGATRHSVYSGQGAAKAFHGSAIHASLPWKDERPETVWKVSLFWLPVDLGFVGEKPAGYSM